MINPNRYARLNHMISTFLLPKGEKAPIKDKTKIIFKSRSILLKRLKNNKPETITKIV